MPTELTWRKAIEKVLQDVEGAMHYKVGRGEYILRNKGKGVAKAKQATSATPLAEQDSEDQ